MATEFTVAPPTPFSYSHLDVSAQFDSFRAHFYSIHSDNILFYPAIVADLSPLRILDHYYALPEFYNLNPVLGIFLAHNVPFVEEPSLPKILSFTTSIPPAFYSHNMSILSVSLPEEPVPFPPGEGTVHRTWDPFVLPKLKNTLNFLREFPDRQLPYFSGGCDSSWQLGSFEYLCFYRDSISPSQLFVYLFKMLWNFGSFTDLTPTDPFTIGDYLTFYTVALLKAYSRVPCLVRAMYPWTCNPLSSAQKDALIRYHSKYVAFGNLPLLSPSPFAINQYFSLLFYAKPTELLHFCTTDFQNWFVNP